MPSADGLKAVRRPATLAVLWLACGVLSGCAWFKAKPSAVAPVAPAAPVAARTPAPALAASSSGPQATPAPPVEPEVAITPATQRAFEDARRLMRAGRMDEAEGALLALTRAAPQLGGPHANLGVLYRDHGHRLAPAIAELETAVRLSPRQPLFHNELGVTYRQAGQFDKARQAYEQALALDPNCAPAVLNLGILLDLYLADGSRALALYERYLALTPGGDATVSKWIADLKNRKPAPATAAAAGKEKP